MKKWILAAVCALSIIAIVAFVMTSEWRHERREYAKTEAALLEAFPHYKEIAMANLDTYKAIFDEIRVLGADIQCISDFSYSLRLTINGEENTYKNSEIGTVAPKLWDALNTLIFKGISTGGFNYSEYPEPITVSLYSHNFGYIVLTETTDMSGPNNFGNWERLEDDWYIYWVVYGGV